MSNGERLDVVGIGTGSSWATAYNLTVDDIHTYYVEVGNGNALVHNTCSDLPKNLRGLDDLADSTARDALRARGGGASNTRALADYMGSWTVRQIGEAAAAGDRDAAAWLAGQGW